MSSNEKQIIQKQLLLKGVFIASSLIYVLGAAIAKYVYSFEGFNPDFSYGELLDDSEVLLFMSAVFVGVAIFQYFVFKSLEIPKSLIMIAIKGLLIMLFSVVGLFIFFITADSAAFVFFALSIALVFLLDHRQVSE